MKTYENFIKDLFKRKPKIDYWDNGQKKSESWLLNGKLHRVDGPSNQEWYENGQKKSESWLLNGKLHREDGPAYQNWYENGQKEYEGWWLNNKKYNLEKWVDKLKEIGSPYYEEQKILLDVKKYNL